MSQAVGFQLLPALIWAGSAVAIAESPADPDLDALVAALQGQFDNAAQYAAAPDQLKVPPSVEGDWLDLQHARFYRVEAAAIGAEVLYLEWRSGSADGPVSRQRIWSFRRDKGGQVRMDFFAFADGGPWVGRGDEPGAFVDLGEAELRGYGPDCALRFQREDEVWQGRITADECELVAASGRRMGIDAKVVIHSDGSIEYQEAGRLPGGGYAFRVPPTEPYRFIRSD